MSTKIIKNVVPWGGMKLEVVTHEKKSGIDRSKERAEIVRKEREAARDYAVSKLAQQYPKIYNPILKPGFDVWFESISGYPWKKRWELKYYKAKYEYTQAYQDFKDAYSAHQRAVKQYMDEDFALLSNSQRRVIHVKLATPGWCDRKEILKIYTECKRITQETGIIHHVDHEVPLRGEYVCGLHVHDNLRIITADENLRKKNKFIPGLDG